MICTHVTATQRQSGWICRPCYRAYQWAVVLRFTPAANGEMFRAMTAMGREWPGRG